MLARLLRPTDENDALRRFDVIDAIVQPPLLLLEDGLRGAADRVAALAGRAHDLNVALVRRTR